MEGVLRRLSSPTFVGRTEELAVLDGVLERAAGGVPAFAFIAGESGVGKSRLIAEFEARARTDTETRSRAQVFVGHCLELGGTVIPYAPLLDALRPVARELAICGDELRDALAPETRAALAELMPEFGEELDGLRAASPDERQGRQARLFEALLALLDRLGRDKPIVLVLEDLHWADASTRDFLTFLVRSARTEPLALVATYRSDEMHRRHPLRPVLAELERAQGVERIGLDRFALSEVEALVAGILDTPPEAGLAERLYARAEGNALYTEELLAAASDECAPLPETLRDALLTRIERLSAPAQAIVRIAAVAERPFQHGLLEAMEETVAPDELMAAAREAVAGHVLVTREDGTYAFRHALVGEAVYDDLLPGERATLHSAIAEALELDPWLLGELPAGSVSAELAMHYHAAHDLPRALAASVQAGQAAERVFAYREAMRHLERAVEIWQRVPDAEERAGLDLAEVLHHAAAVANHAGEASRAVALGRRAVAEVDDTAHPLRAAALQADLGKLLRATGDEAGSDAAYACAMALLPPDARQERAHLLEQHAMSMMLRGHYQEAEALATEASELARKHGDVDVLSRASITLGMTRGALHGADEGLALLRKARDTARGPADLSRAVVNLTEVLDLSGRSEEALAEARALLERAKERPERSAYDAFLGLQEVNILMRLGRFDEAIAHLPERVPGDSAGSAHMYLRALRLELATRRGDTSAAGDLEAARRLNPVSRAPQWVEPLQVNAAQLAVRAGRYAEARAAVAAGLNAVRESEEGLRMLRLVWAGLMVEAEAAEQVRALGGEFDRAPTEALTRDLEAAQRLPAQWAEGAPYAALARAELNRIHHAADGAAADPAAWTTSADAFEALALPWPTAYARLRAAEAHVLAGEREAAGVALASACAAARAMGALPLVLEAEALGRRARLRTDAEEVEAPAAAASSPAEQLGLTPRELEVLLLVAEGRTNKEIGATLFMSEKTASVHVSRILAKLDVGGRVEAAAVAHRLGLTDPVPAQSRS
jgi:DNA-binding CsgD family transcriptional regulator/tetratricopeptide (TPR) repeat protein